MKNKKSFIIYDPFKREFENTASDPDLTIINQDLEGLNTSQI